MELAESNKLEPGRRGPVWVPKLQNCTTTRDAALRGGNAENANLTSLSLLLLSDLLLVLPIGQIQPGVSQSEYQGR